MDDILITRSDEKHIEDMIKRLNDSFAYKILGSISYFLGPEIKRDKSGMHISQTKYILDQLYRTNMEESNDSPSPRSTCFKLVKEGAKDSKKEERVSQINLCTEATLELCYMPL